MGAWSKIVKGVKALFSSGSASAAASAGSKLLTWGNVAKAAVVGVFAYLFCTGGLSNVVATTLGIPEWAAQLIIVAVFILLLALAVRYLINWLKARGLKEEYLENRAFNRPPGQAEGRGDASRDSEPPRNYVYVRAYDDVRSDVDSRPGRWAWGPIERREDAVYAGGPRSGMDSVWIQDGSGWAVSDLREDPYRFDDGSQRRSRQ